MIFISCCCLKSISFYSCCHVHIHSSYFISLIVGIDTIRLISICFCLLLSCCLLSVGTILSNVCSISILSTCIFAAFSSRIATSLSRNLCPLLFVLIFNLFLDSWPTILNISIYVFYSWSLVVLNQRISDQKCSQSVSQDSFCPFITQILWNVKPWLIWLPFSWYSRYWE